MGYLIYKLQGREVWCRDENESSRSSELKVSEIRLGCMSVGTDERKAVALIHEALDRGINLLDTADLYDNGRNEELVGKAIEGRRDRIVLATKAGNRRIPGQRIPGLWAGGIAISSGAIADAGDG
jgi:aryl-alcohol dehydrogenase-like predicted oxidoreductase